VPAQEALRLNIEVRRCKSADRSGACLDARTGPVAARFLSVTPDAVRPQGSGEGASRTVLIDAPHAALEDRERVFGRVRMNVARTCSSWL
jgi:hypothetical protein